MKLFDYDRNAAVAYAAHYALKRNPGYYDFERLGGDCTNFVSQCLYAGGGIMNYTPTFGWFYSSVNDRTAAWTGVEFLFRFLTLNDSSGPFASLSEPEALELGDIVQLGKSDGDFYHTAIVSGFKNGEILLASHSNDALNQPLSSYVYEQARFLHVEGFRGAD